MGYNARLQLASLAYTSGSSTLLSLGYSYTSAAVPGNDGQIQSITDNVDNGRSETFTYDAWGRLATAQTAGSANFPAWGLSWTYDRYGNRLAQNVTAGTAPSNSVGVDPTTNRINSAGYGYDLAGNMTNDGLNTMVYDGENHVASSTQASVTTNYTYDGNGLRLEKATGSNSTVYLFSGGKVVAEYDNAAAVASPSREYIYSGGQLLATIDSTGTKYHLSGHLSPDITTDSSGNVIGTQAHYPFGEKWYETGTTTKYKFTSYERDPETGNDYAIARYHINRLGRFGSVDRHAGNIGNPQSLNRYAYVLNNPVNLIDPFGLDDCPKKGDDGGDGGDGSGDCGGGGGGGGSGDGGGGGTGPDAPPDPFGPPTLPDPSGPDSPFGPNPDPPPPGPEPITVVVSADAPPDEVTSGSDPGGIALANNLLGGIGGGSFKSKPKCKAFFAALISQNNLKTTPEALMNQVASAASASQNNVFDGPSSSVPLTPQSFPGYSGKTVGDTFAADPRQQGLSQFDGSAIYIRAGQWEPALFGLVPSSFNGPYGSGTLMHELLHKQAVSGGFSHDQMDSATSAVVQGSLNVAPGHNATSDLLGKLCF